ncbi:DUF4166 domain-containing protein [Parasulfitobacter algicola]|uniref:DUF4166 domain-containing protein n=1 Tax=Parasulfitobacter algicola TaxID=2614809 RepID=A0ABX2IWZ9_9RHOB|nr:DUF4166 domain-containing protein [Sulfitobacter algicola]NSX54838.1 DUF4166 domain-containing protein [Sulfitobacter algicola]
MHIRHIISPEARDPDTRFYDLLGQENWFRLPPAVRRRFGKKLKAGASVVYQGEVTAMKISRLGKILAQVTRLIGAPLPYDLSSIGKPAVVTVTEDCASSGQFWIRQYGRQSGFPQLVHSSKRFAGSTGLEEYIGFGIGIALRVEATNDALLFKSDHYFLKVFGRRWRLPRVLSPGALTIGHHDLGDSKFLFSLNLHNRLFGLLVQQDAVFQDAKE